MHPNGKVALLQNRECHQEEQQLTNDLMPHFISSTTPGSDRDLCLIILMRRR